jgi:PKD repeat protein
MGIVLIVTAILVIAIIAGFGNSEKTVAHNQFAGGQQPETVPPVPVNTQHDAPPYAGFTCTPSSGIAPLTVLCNSSASQGRYSSIDTYGWDFGDGSQLQGVNATIGHTYFNPGTYTVLLFVHESGGLGSTARQDIIVLANATLTSK